MLDLLLFISCFIVKIDIGTSKPLWPIPVSNDYIYLVPGTDAPELDMTEYQNTQSPYYIHKIPTDVEDIPSTIPINKPEIWYNSDYHYFYKMPTYHFFLLNPIYPVLTPPEFLPRPILPPTSTQQPSNDDDDGAEKLDSKVDLTGETEKSENTHQDDDTITVEAI